VDWIPALEYLPDSLAPWRSEAKKSFADIMRFWSVFYDSIVERAKTGQAPDCFLTRFLEDKDAKLFTDTEKRVLLGSILAAGSETTSTALRWFFKAMVLYPRVVAAAQEELDRVVGPDRMPGWDDRPNLPYIDAIMSEVSLNDAMLPSRESLLRRLPL
jgi:cytochrome P450